MPIPLNESAAATTAAILAGEHMRHAAHATEMSDVVVNSRQTASPSVWNKIVSTTKMAPPMTMWMPMMKQTRMSQSHVIPLVSVEQGPSLVPV